MTIYKLLELINKVDNRDIYKPGISELKDFTDDEINLILSSDNQNEVKRLLKNTVFRSLPNEIQQNIIKIIDSSNTSKDRLYYAIDIATNQTAINSGYITELVEIILNIEDSNKLSAISVIAKNSIATSHKDMLKMIQMLIESDKDKVILSYAEMLMKNEYAFRTGNILEAFTAILNAQNEKEAQEIFSNKFTEGLSKSLLSVLDEEKMDSINFWNLLTEDYEMGLKLLLLTKFPKTILIKAQVVTEQEYDELNEKYFLENIAEPHSSSNEELSPNIRIRRKNKIN